MTSVVLTLELTLVVSVKYIYEKSMQVNVVSVGKVNNKSELSVTHDNLPNTHDSYYWLVG